jgi:hypothetical protein
VKESAGRWADTLCPGLPEAKSNATMPVRTIAADLHLVVVPIILTGSF